MTGQFAENYISPRLKAFSVFYSNRLSFEEVARLVERVTGADLLSDQTIWNLATDKAQQMGTVLMQEVNDALATETVEGVSVNPNVDLYAPDGNEILLFQDGIQVKQQKEKRSSQETGAESPSKKLPGLNTDVALLEKQSGDYEYISAPINEKGEPLISLGTVLKVRVAQEYSHHTEPLNLVAITDGARSIAKGLKSAFGQGLVMILDWYHLVKKLRSLMSMIAWDREQKAVHLKFIVSKLWLGKTEEVLAYLRTEINPRREDKWKELIGYLTKHQAEIINYNRRSRAGKVIGSGRMEKGVDLNHWPKAEEEGDELAGSRKSVPWNPQSG
ncbi:MAG: hypothetical protein AAF329_18405 [Cyanobacteria bacterium P01_A01_bin.17]